VCGDSTASDGSRAKQCSGDSRANGAVAMIVVVRVVGQIDVTNVIGQTCDSSKGKLYM
jgi:hypothetical protein